MASDGRADDGRRARRWVTRRDGAALAVLGLVLAAGCGMAGLRASPPDPVRPAPPKTPSYRVVAIGDTQQMNPVEWVMRGGPVERRRVRAKVQALGPDVVLHAGDIVGDGFSSAQWAEFRELYAGVPIWPVLGNHDVAGPNGVALESYFETFPHVEGRRWYAVRYPPAVFLMLDSNRSNMSGDEWKAQGAWLREELDRAEADPEVRGIVLVTHHPPFSVNISGGNGRVRADLFDEAAKRSKFVAYLAGHHHAYQHIEVEGGRHVFVTGGGGAPLLLWKAARLPKGARLVHAREAHHVLELRVGPEGMVAVMHELAAKEEAWTVGEEATIPWPARPGRLY